jgi:creatinine amidohydrolase
MGRKHAASLLAIIPGVTTGKSQRGSRRSSSRRKLPAEDREFPLLADWTYADLRDHSKPPLFAILPIGAIEAHGPHLPLGTDNLIAEAMAAEGARRLRAEAISALVLPTLPYTAAPFAANFPGTLSLRAETVILLLLDLAWALERGGFHRMVLANAHFDPAHLQALYDAIGRIHAETALQVVFPDVTRKPWALELTEEFRSGACHAGCYESSIILATRPDLVRERRRRELEANPESLSRAIWQGHRTFEEAGGTDAYFGDPAAATGAEGHKTIEVLGSILARAVLASLE